MRLVLKTYIQKIAFASIILAIITIFLLVFRQYELSIIGIVLIVIFAVIFFRLLPEELLVYALKQNSGRMARKDLIAQLSIKAEKAMPRMIKKGLVEVEGDYVILSNPGKLSAFEERKK